MSDITNEFKREMSIVADPIAVAGQANTQLSRMLDNTSQISDVISQAIQKEWVSSDDVSQWIVSVSNLSPDTMLVSSDGKVSNLGHLIEALKQQDLDIGNDHILVETAGGVADATIESFCEGMGSAQSILQILHSGTDALQSDKDPVAQATRFTEKMQGYPKAININPDLFQCVYDTLAAKNLSIHTKVYQIISLITSMDSATPEGSVDTTGLGIVKGVTLSDYTGMSPFVVCMGLLINGTISIFEAGFKWITNPNVFEALFVDPFVISWNMIKETVKLIGKLVSAIFKPVMSGFIDPIDIKLLDDNGYGSVDGCFLSIDVPVQTLHDRLDYVASPSFVDNCLSNALTEFDNYGDILELYSKMRSGVFYRLSLPCNSVFAIKRPECYTQFAHPGCITIIHQRSCIPASLYTTFNNVQESTGDDYVDVLSKFATMGHKTYRSMLNTESDAYNHFIWGARCGYRGPIWREFTRRASSLSKSASNELDHVQNALVNNIVPPGAILNNEWIQEFIAYSKLQYDAYLRTSTYHPSNTNSDSRYVLAPYEFCPYVTTDVTRDYLWDGDGQGNKRKSYWSLMLLTILPLSFIASTIDDKGLPRMNALPVTIATNIDDASYYINTDAEIISGTYAGLGLAIGIAATAVVASVFMKTRSKIRTARLNLNAAAYGLNNQAALERLNDGVVSQTTAKAIRKVNKRSSLLSLLEPDVSVTANTAYLSDGIADVLTRLG